MQEASGLDQVSARILVVEDDVSINEVICETLSGNGYRCIAAYSGTEAQMAFGQKSLSGDFRNPIDLIVCDLMLPGISGEEFIQSARRAANMPVLVVSAKSTVEDRVELLRLGADDYLVKPFDLDELLARVEALLRRCYSDAVIDRRFVDRSLEDAKCSILRFGSWELDLDARSLVVEGASVRLTRTEFDIVHALMRHPGKVFTKGELYEAAWREEAVVEEKTVNTHVSNIRTKLKGTHTEDYIETVWGIGFRLADINR